tara:strand:- start:144 stop:809 length:666 start_codon:yes stop_codon:yes gene_type:complete
MTFLNIAGDLYDAYELATTNLANLREILNLPSKIKKFFEDNEDNSANLRLIETPLGVTTMINELHAEVESLGTTHKLKLLIDDLRQHIESSESYAYSGVNNMDVSDEDNDVLGVNGIKSIYGDLSQNNINDSDESNTIFNKNCTSFGMSIASANVTPMIGSFIFKKSTAPLGNGLYFCTDDNVGNIKLFNVLPASKRQSDLPSLLLSNTFSMSEVEPSLLP